MTVHFQSIRTNPEQNTERMKAKLSTKNPDDWFVYYRLNGRLMKKRAGINRISSIPERRAYGKQLCDRVNQLISGGIVADPVAVVQLRKIVEDKKSSLRRRSWQSYLYAVNSFEKWLPDPSIRMQEITRKEARAFLDHLLKQGHQGKSVNGVRGFLMTIFNHYCERNEGYVNPFRGTPVARQQVGKNIAFSDQQKAQLWEAMTPELKLFTRFIYFTYIRPIELLRLRVSDIRMDMGQIVIHGSQSKNKQQQAVVLPDVFLSELREVGYDKMPSDWFLFGRGLRPGPVSLGRNAVSMMHSELLESFGYHSDLTLYSWKHTGVVAAYQAGIDIYSIMRQLRHHSLDMTQIYLKSLGLVKNEQFGSLMR